MPVHRVPQSGLSGTHAFTELCDGPGRNVGCVHGRRPRTSAWVSDWKHTHYHGRQIGGAGQDRTDEWRFCKPLPYHLATAPKAAFCSAFDDACHAAFLP